MALIADDAAADCANGVRIFRIRSNCSGAGAATDITIGVGTDNAAVFTGVVSYTIDSDIACHNTVLDCTRTVATRNAPHLLVAGDAGVGDRQIPDGSVA